jgi:hypothetical protein
MSIGGGHISLEESFVCSDRVAKDGFHMNYRVVLRKMPRWMESDGHCHANVIHLWLEKSPWSRMYAIGTGYALTDDDGVWLPHSWCLQRTNHGVSIIETTSIIGDKYFGLQLSGRDADKFADPEGDGFWKR